MVRGFFLGFISFCFLLDLQSTLYGASKRFAAIDVESSALSPQEKELILKVAREKVSKWRVWSVVSKEEIAQKMAQPNVQKIEFNKLTQESKESSERLKAHLQAAISLYQQSLFFEALKSFEQLLDEVRSAPLDTSAEFTRDLFQNYLAAAFFEDRIPEAQAIFLSLKNLDPAFKLSPEHFPPNLIEKLESVASKDEEITRWSFQSDQKGFAANFWGFTLPIFEDDKQSIDLPTKDLYLKKSPLVLTKDGYFPQIIWIDSLPTKIHWESLSDKTKSTKGLFAPLGSITANPELKWFITQLQLSVLLLISAEKKNDKWQLQGQWYEGSTGRSSEVREVKTTDVSLGTETLLEEMLNDIAPDGRIIDPRGYSGAEPARISESGKPFYKTWWFWTLASAGLVGAGYGTYAILNSSDSLKFQVKAAP